MIWRINPCVHVCFALKFINWSQSPEQLYKCFEFPVNTNVPMHFLHKRMKESGPVCMNKFLGGMFMLLLLRNLWPDGGGFIRFEGLLFWWILLKEARYPSCICLSWLIWLAIPRILYLYSWFHQLCNWSHSHKYIQNIYEIKTLCIKVCAALNPIHMGLIFSVFHCPKENRMHILVVTITHAMVTQGWVPPLRWYPEVSFNLIIGSLSLRHCVYFNVY